MTLIVKMIIVGILFAIAVISGIWLSAAGKPLNKIIFNFHKLIALASVVFGAIFIYPVFKNIGIKGISLLLISADVIFIVILFITGALLSIEKFSTKILLLIHNSSAVLALIAVSAAIYLIYK